MRLQRILVVFGLLFTSLLAIVSLLVPSLFEHLENKSTDTVLRLAGPPASGAEIAIVDIDEASLQEYGQWPWPRNLFARLLAALHEAGATSIGIDIIFPERDRSSPKVWQETLARNFGSTVDTTAIPEELLDNDLFLAKTLARGPFVLGYEFLFGKSKPQPFACRLPPAASTTAGGEEDGPRNLTFYHAEDVLCSFRPLTRAAPGAGFLNGTPDKDGIIRRLPLLIEWKGALYPSFALAVVMQASGQKELSFDTRGLRGNYVSLGSFHIPIDQRGNFLLSPHRPAQSVRYSAKDILTGTINAAHLRKKIVLVGTAAVGFDQGYPTPFSSAKTVLDLQAFAVHTLLAATPTIRSPYLPLAEAAISLVLSLLLAVHIARRPTAWSFGGCLLLIAVVWGLAISCCRYSGLLFSPLLPTVVLLGNCFLLLILKYRYFQLQAKSETGKALLLLNSSEATLQSILRTIPDIVFRLDGSGNITFLSPSISKYLRSPEELLGTPIFEYVLPEDRNRARYRLNERRTRERSTVDLEIRLRFTREDQQDTESYRFFSISAEGLYRGTPPGRHEFIGTQGIIKDITDRKRLEHQLLRAQKMEVVGNLAAGIAHDLNNILGGLVSYPDFLLLEIPKDDPLHEKITIIQRSGHQAAAIVRDLLTLARRNVVLTGIVNMNAIISDYLDSIEFRHLRERHPGISLRTRLDDALMNVKGSAVHLAKIVMNCVHNALEAMPAGGTLEIATENAVIDTVYDSYERIPAGEYVRVAIADDGVGIPQADIHRIFEPFYTKKSTAQSGTGLGMTIIWATVKDHNGYLDINSREGHGTILHIYLPATRESEIPPPEKQAVLEDYLGSETILVVDDVAEQLDITGRLLKKLGYTVLTATRGEEAVAMMRERPVDLVVLDMIMPEGFDGLETYMRMREVAPRQKVLLTSGYSDSERVQEALRLGAGGYLQKPFTMEQIGLAVRKELNASEDAAPADR